MPETMPVFKPMRARRMFLSLGGREWLRVAVAMGLGALLALGLGGWAHEVQARITSTEAQRILSEHYERLAAVQEAERLMDAAGTRDLDLIDLSDDERALLAEAAELGITASTSRSELSALVPATVAAVKPVVPDLPRWAICFVLPSLATALVNLELWHGTSLLKEAKRFARFHRMQRSFASTPKAYLLQGGEDR